MIYSIYWLIFVNVCLNQIITFGCIGESVFQLSAPTTENNVSIKQELTALNEQKMSIELSLIKRSNNEYIEKKDRRFPSDDQVHMYNNEKSNRTILEYMLSSTYNDKRKSLNFEAANKFIQNLNDIKDNKFHVYGGNVENSNLTSNEERTNTMKQGERKFQRFPSRRHISSFKGKLEYTKQIHLKQGRLIGITRNFPQSTGLLPVDQYLGIPYAESPINTRRFMPPAPLPWPGVKIARHLPPVCPQKLPRFISPQEQQLHENREESISRGRYKYLTRLLPYLKNENEDCLYLNLYVPKNDSFVQENLYSVIVYIHGESFEWNSGNPYDGSVLASYGQTIVVTFNYRLGILGFMKPSTDDNTVANFGLLDQIAALHWIKENIESFGGNKHSITLMGHSTGAACINYLMISPVAFGLFHRAILMSGSSLSDWAVSNNSVSLTMKIAHGLNCSLYENEDMLSCLRQKSYKDIFKLIPEYSQFSTLLGPIIDGHVIPHQPSFDMSQYTEQFSRYDLLFGITESESYHWLGPLALRDGLRENDRDNILRFYMQTRFHVRPDLVLAATLKKYNDIYNNPRKATQFEHRDVLLDILSDARTVGPLLQTGLYHAEVNRRNFMYVFGHSSDVGPHGNLAHSIIGEELGFIFGAPLAPSGPFPNNYSIQEKLLAEAVIRYWTNFAKTGNPKAPWSRDFIHLHALEWDRYDLNWPEFNKRTQAYINIGIPPSIGYKYRYIYMNFWNKELPDELNQIASIEKQSFESINLHPIGRWNKYANSDNGGEDPVRTLKFLLQEHQSQNENEQYLETLNNMYNASMAFGRKTQSNQDFMNYNNNNNNNNNNNIFSPDSKSIPLNKFVSFPEQNGFHQLNSNKLLVFENTVDNKNEKKKDIIIKSESRIYILIIVILLFIILNIIIFSILMFRKKRKSTKALQRNLGMLSYECTANNEFKRSKQMTVGDGDESLALDIIRKSNTYEAIKTERSPINGFKLTRQLSTSTIDSHTKVCAWMSRGRNEIKSYDQTFKYRDNQNQDTNAFNEQNKSNDSKKHLNIEPFFNPHIIVCRDVEIKDENFLVPELIEPNAKICCQMDESEKVTSFINTSSYGSDINVTRFSNEEVYKEENVNKAEEEFHQTSKKVYQQVLPTNNTYNIMPLNADLNTTLIQNSLPVTVLNYNKCPPIPPLRILNRCPELKLNSDIRNNTNVITSPAQLAQNDIFDEDEPEITQNTLIVGPIIPKLKKTGLKNNFEIKQKKIDGSCETRHDTLQFKDNNTSKNIFLPLNSKHHTEKVHSIQSRNEHQKQLYTIDSPKTAHVVCIQPIIHRELKPVLQRSMSLPIKYSFIKSDQLKSKLIVSSSPSLTQYFNRMQDELSNTTLKMIQCYSLDVSSSSSSSNSIGTVQLSTNSVQK